MTTPAALPMSWQTECGRAFDRVMLETDTELVREVLTTLNERESSILSLRFGLKDGNQRTLEEIGAKLGVTRERIRQIRTALKNCANGWKNRIPDGGHRLPWRWRPEPSPGKTLAGHAGEKQNRWRDQFYFQADWPDRARVRCCLCCCLRLFQLQSQWRRAGQLPVAPNSIEGRWKAVG